MSKAVQEEGHNLHQFCSGGKVEGYESLDISDLFQRHSRTGTAYRTTCIFNGKKRSSSLNSPMELSMKRIEPSPQLPVLPKMLTKLNSGITAGGDSQCFELSVWWTVICLCKGLQTEFQLSSSLQRDYLTCGKDNQLKNYIICSKNERKSTECFRISNPQHKNELN